MANQPERNIQNNICKFLDIVGIPYLVYDSKGGYDPIRKAFRKLKNRRNGVSDLLVFNKKTKETYFIEIKTKTGRMSQNQKEFRDWITGYGFIYEVWRSVDDARKFIKEQYQERK